MDICPFHDLPNSPLIRQYNLLQYLEKAKSLDIMLLGEAPGYLGCRRTGLPFTDERHLSIFAQYYQTSPLKIATKSGSSNEKTAFFMWNTLPELKARVFLWNAIPLHPHQTNIPLSNRSPSMADFHATQVALEYLLENGHFPKIFAVGRVAEKFLHKLGISPVYIRHPSRGGSSYFRQQLIAQLVTP